MKMQINHIVGRTENINSATIAPGTIVIDRKKKEILFSDDTSKLESGEESLYRVGQSIFNDDEVASLEALIHSGAYLKCQYKHEIEGDNTSPIVSATFETWDPSKDVLFYDGTIQIITEGSIPAPVIDESDA